MSETDAQRLQQQMVLFLKKEGFLHDPLVERAFATVPRHLFLPNEPLERVYSDVAIAVKQGEGGRWTSSSSQPAIMAIMLEQLGLQPGMRVLEIGAGSGFNAALLAAIVGREGAVVTVDIQPDLIDAARAHLDAAGFDWVQAVAGDGGEGWAAGAPYDRIILTASSPVIPPAWREQLVEGGRLVLPLNIYGTQRSVAFEKRGEALESISLSDCGFMPLQGAFTVDQPARRQVGPDPRVYLHPVRNLPDLPMPLLTMWIGGPWRDLSSGVRVALQEIFNGLYPWLALRGPDTVASLMAEGSRSFPSVIPPLAWMGHLSEWRVMQTLLEVDVTAQGQARSAAALVRPPWEPAPLVDFRQPGDAATRHWSAPFELYVRQFGRPDAAIRVIEGIRAWDAAGRPSTRSMHIRAFPAGASSSLARGEFLVEQPWTCFAVRFDPPSHAAK